MSAKTHQPHPEPPPPLVDDVRALIRLAAANATDDDRRFVAALVQKAVGATFHPEVLILTPGACALLFLDHNPHNRALKPKGTLEYARRMRAQDWALNFATIGFYDDG